MTPTGTDAAAAGSEGAETRQLDALDYLLKVRRACLLPLPTLTLPEDMTLQALKLQLLSSPSLCVARSFAESHPTLATPRPVLESECVGPSLADVGWTPKQLRIREKGLNNVPGRVLKGDGKSLKSLYVAGGKEFVIEVLSEPETLPDESLVLWVQRRWPNPAVIGSGTAKSSPDNTTAAAFSGSNSPMWPPECVVLRCPPKPTYTDFTTALSAHSDIPLDKLRVAKLFLAKKVRDL